LTIDYVTVKEFLVKENVLELKKIVINKINSNTINNEYFLSQVYKNNFRKIIKFWKSCESNFIKNKKLIEFLNNVTTNEEQSVKFLKQFIDIPLSKGLNRSDQRPQNESSIVRPIKKEDYTNTYIEEEIKINYEELVELGVLKNLRTTIVHIKNDNRELDFSSKK